ncbi:uncharacterized protein CXQ87_004563 [Candidozyma duobushaemuli]|uniref:Striatin N-terminal domain-containing protein n=1 Tax=Candidozyma duobushaemuli TaxID=1231522 RepID=A0A2V1AHB3_9ASCO|nr:uncharacterized protein CXQ87_004563 [[Candida] duobushaemulonis]PVH17004.1 hypothetical protein CXQ87_004563 [[Candida] duobushaemulonis]
MSKKTTNAGRREPSAFGSFDQPAHNEPTPVLQQQNPSPTANYNLPGVISYLTSEFTHLERFKITTNLEKSEMSYRISQLTSEVNSLRYINDKQAVRIRELEQKLGESSIGEPKKDTQIPQVDLDVLKDSRIQLNKSIRDVVRVLKPPSALSRNYINAPNTSHGTDFDELLDDSEKFSFENEAHDEKVRESIFARYMNDASDEPLSGAFEDDAQRLVESVQGDLENQNSPISRKPPAEDAETDTETVIVDETEDALASAKQAVVFGQETRLLARNCVVFEPFQNAIVFMEEESATVLESGVPALKTKLDHSTGHIVGVYYLGKKRLLVVGQKGVSLVTSKESGTATTKVLLKEEKFLIDSCSLVESSDKHYALAFSGMGKDGKSVIAVHEIKLVNKPTARLLGSFNSTFLKAWSEKKDTEEELPYDLIVLHEKIQRLNIANKSLVDIKPEADYHSISVVGGLLLAVQPESVEVYDLSEEKTVGVLPRHKHAHYVLSTQSGLFVAEASDQVVVFDKEMQELARHTNPIGSPKSAFLMESEEGTVLILQGTDGISILPVGLV